MNPLDDQLDRLLRAAGRAAVGTGTLSAPFGLETRVLAAWRGASVPSGIWNTALLVRGLLLASVIMVFCLWPALTEKAPGPDTEYLQLADSTLQGDNL